MALGIGPHNGNAAMQVVNTDVDRAGASGPGGLLNETKDMKHSATDANFGEVMKQFQAKYGAKPEKPRQIKKQLGKDDFLKIMITQMKNQDPTKPFDAEQMAAQMAQYASVEQLQNLNQNVQKLQGDNKTNERMQMAGMLGKVVTIDRERFPHVEGQNESLAYALPRGASQVKLTIMSDTGETILEKDLGPQKQGEQSFSWDGAKENTLPAKTGTYIFKISAKDSKGLPIPINPKTKGRVIGVGFEGAEPFFLVGDAHNQQKVTMKNIIEVDEDRPGALQAAVQPAANGNNFFTFKKGQGSENLDQAGLSPEAQAALARYQAVNNGGAAQGQAQAQAQNPALLQAQNAEQNIGGNMGTPSGKGFPNGLSDSGGQ